ncbi:MAG: hypothetical protein LBI69_02960 [Puniceicoccales bacterium]|jgi:hypothetical protein|nr:hypothetical protein [Puniceicoccales bacterium]
MDMIIVDSIQNAVLSAPSPSPPDDPQPTSPTILSNATSSFAFSESCKLDLPTFLWYGLPESKRVFSSLSSGNSANSAGSDINYFYQSFPKKIPSYEIYLLARAIQSIYDCVANVQKDCIGKIFTEAFNIWARCADKKNWVNSADLTYLKKIGKFGISFFKELHHCTQGTSIPDLNALISDLVSIFIRSESVEKLYDHLGGRSNNSSPIAKYAVFRSLRDDCAAFLEKLAQKNLVYGDALSVFDCCKLENCINDKIQIINQIFTKMETFEALCGYANVPDESTD